MSRAGRSRPAQRPATTVWMTMATGSLTRWTQTASASASTETASPTFAARVSSASLTAAACRTAATVPGTVTRGTSTAAGRARPSAKVASTAGQTLTARRAAASTTFANREREASHEMDAPSGADDPRPGVLDLGAGAPGHVAGSYCDQGGPRADSSGSGDRQGPAGRGTAPPESAFSPGQSRAERTRAHECGRRSDAGTRRRAGDPRRVLRLPVSLLPAVLRDDATDPEEGLHRRGQGALRVPRLPPRDAPARP